MEKTNKEYLDSLVEIRTMMEKSSRFISLSGLSGVFAGLYALLGASLAYAYFNQGIMHEYYQPSWLDSGELNNKFVLFVLIDAAVVIALSLLTGIYFTSKKAKRNGHPVWSRAARMMLLNTLIPILVGGIFCLIMLYHGFMGLIAPSTLIFYGLALLNGSKYTHDDVKHLGIAEIVLGLTASVFMTYGLFFWALGFGLLHIIYGVLMYYKHEKKITRE